MNAVINLFMQRSERILLILTIGYCLYGCHAMKTETYITAPPINPISNHRHVADVIKSGFVTRPQYSDFSVCYGHTCQYYVTLSLAADDWQYIRNIFSFPAVYAGEEREQIRKAIAYLETIIGEMTGTANDRGENFTGMGESGQMDCVDEATNTSSYLTMMQADNLLKWHTVDYRVSRGIGSFQAPHFTAVIREKQGGKYFAVDSWFLDNGEPPFIVPLVVWKKGWKPGDPYQGNSD
jgi:hypothetical protein